MTSQYLTLKASALGIPASIQVHSLWGVLYRYIVSDEQVIESGLHRRVAIPEKRTRCREGNKFGGHGTVAYLSRRADGLLNLSIHAHLVRPGDGSRPVCRMTVTLRDAEHFVGMPYDPQTFDCGSLAVLVQRELFGRAVALPNAGRRSRGRRGQAREIASQQLAARIEHAETGCAAVFWEATPHGIPPLNRSWHIGTVFLNTAGAVWILHAANEVRGTVLDRLNDMTGKGMHLDGYFRWH